MNTVIIRRRERKSHIWDREEHEHYVEPQWVSEQLFKVAEPFFGEICDPACGFGTILQSAKNAQHSAFGSDIVYRGFRDEHGLPSPVKDFFSETSIVDNIVTNPPFDIAPEFIQHALKLARHKVAAIFPTARLNAARWLQSTPLARVWLLTPRPSMPPGHVIKSGEKPGGGKTDFAWLVFEQGHTGGVQMGWLLRDE